MPITKNINCLVQMTLGPVLKLTLKNKSDIGGQEWLQETLILRFIVLLTIISSLRIIFKKSSLQMTFQKSLFHSKPNVSILLINTKWITLLKKRLNRFLRNIYWKGSVKRYKKSFVHLYLCTFVSLYLSNKNKKKNYLNSVKSLNTISTVDFVYQCAFQRETWRKKIYSL